MDESVLPVTEKERRGEGKSSIDPRMKYGHANRSYFMNGSGVALFDMICKFSNDKLVFKFFQHTNDVTTVSFCRGLSNKKA